MTDDATITDAGEMDLGIEVSKGVVAKFIQAGLGFAGTIIFARMLGPVGFGGFYILLSVVTILDKPVVGGWASASKKRFSEAGVDRGDIVGAQTAFNVGMIAVLAVIIFALRDWLATFTGLENAGILFFALFVPIVFFYPYQNMVVARGMVGRQVAIDTFRSVVTLGAQLALVLIGWGAAGLAVGLGAATVMMLPLTYYSLGVRPSLPSRETFASLWAFARHSIPVSMVSKVFDRYDTLLLGLLLGQAAAADYEVAFKLTVPAMFVAIIGGSALMPKVSNLRSRDESVAQDITNILAFASILSIPIFFGALAIPEKLVLTTYGGEYRGAGILLIGLALFRVLRTQSWSLQEAINGLDRPDLNFRISASTLALNVVAGYLLVAEIGAVGIVVATVAAEALRYLLCGYVMRREIPGIALLPFPIAEQVAAGAVMYLAVVGFTGVVPIRSWVDLLVTVLLGGAIYGGVLFVLSKQVRGMSTKVLGAFAQRLADLP